MSDELRSLHEHLADPALYAGPPASSAHPVAWRAALLARYPERPRHRRPVSGAAELRRLIALVALPLAAATAVALLAMAGVEFTLRPALPSLPTERLLAETLQAPHYVWYGLAGLSLSLTFLVRGRLPRLLPMDW